MSINIGGIDITDTLINTEYRIGVLERVIDKLIAVAPPGTLTANDMEQIRNDVFSSMQRKYPNAGISKKP